MKWKVGKNKNLPRQISRSDNFADAKLFDWVKK